MRDIEVSSQIVDLMYRMESKTDPQDIHAQVKRDWKLDVYYVTCICGFD